MSDIINQIADAIEAEIHEAWTESDADFIRGMEYAVSIVKAVDIRTDSDTISRADAVGAVQDHFNADGFKGYDDGQKMMDRIKALPSAEQVTGKLNNPDDSLLTADSEACKEQKSKLDLISRQAAINAIPQTSVDLFENCRNCELLDRAQVVVILESLPSAPDSRQRGEWVSNHDGSWNCSECGLRVFVYAKGNYCPNCGADMRGEEE